MVPRASQFKTGSVPRAAPITLRAARDEAKGAAWTPTAGAPRGEHAARFYTGFLYSHCLVVNHPLPEVHLGQGDTLEPELPLAAEGVLRYVWHGRFGDMLVEVRDQRVFVNGQLVEPASGEAQAQ